MLRSLLTTVALLACAPPRHPPARVSEASGALAPLVGAPAAPCTTFTPSPGAEGLTHGLLLQLEGATTRRIRAGFDAAGRPRVVTVVAEGPAVGAPSTAVRRVAEYVELSLDTAGQVRRGRRARVEDGSVVDMPPDGFPLTLQDSAAGALLARAIRAHCAR